MDNPKRNPKVIIGLVLAIAAIALLSYFLFFRENGAEGPYEPEDIPPTYNGSVELQEDNFILNAQYVGDNTWEYTVDGTLPTPCHEYTITPQIRESFPEQVEVVIAVTSDSEVMCVQVIQEVEDSGTFSASEEAQVTLTVISGTELEN